ncbi:MAG: aminotransferase class I/II-fold pyridoxal phosphate-dependent enzyme [Tissierellaceae bacterium]|nr:aminotransferase class I/II-fold pyridoxal phosphate-dependent enzyme [Tissierellaceae bacterium]
MNTNNLRKSTKAVYTAPDPLTGAVSTPIYQTATYQFKSTQEGAARFLGEEEGYIYARLGNPTTQQFEQKISALENAEASLAFASGMGAISAVLFHNLKAGDHIISQSSIYGCTYDILTSTIPNLGVDVTFVDGANPLEIMANLRPTTKYIYVETIANPTLTIADIPTIAEVTRSHNGRYDYGCQLVVDNTFASPYFCNPIDLGADIVLHSATKYIGGHGDVLAGVVSSDAETIASIAGTTQKNIGSILGPQDAYLLLRGLKTLPIRMKEQQKSAFTIANHLLEHPKVEKVHYPGLVSHPQYDIATNIMSGYGSVISFEVKGGVEAGSKLLNNLKLIHLAVSLGSVDSFIEHPASMTHSIVPEEDRLKANISNGLIRFSVGLEDVRDLLEDLEQALDKI